MATPMRARSSRRKFRCAFDSLEARTLFAGDLGAAPAALHGAVHLETPAARSRANALLTASSRPKELAAAVKGLSSTNGGLPSVPLLARVGYYVTPADGGFPHFVAVNDLTASELQTLKTKLASKNADVYVLAHGWSPGYQDWVDNYAKGKHKILDWWQTIPENYKEGTSDPAYMKVLSYAGTASGDQTAPVSPWLLEGHTGGDVTGQTPIVESDNGLAWDLAHDGDPSKTAKVDPHAVVLAYSWLDGAATPPIDPLDPLNPLTTGRTAEAVTEFRRVAASRRGPRTVDRLRRAKFHGKLQLIGHSFGSKVVTVAADALVTKPRKPHPCQPAHTARLTRKRQLESVRGQPRDRRRRQRQLVLPARSQHQQHSVCRPIVC